MIQQSTRASTLHWLMFASGTTTFLLMLAISLLPLNGLPLLAVVISLLTAQLALVSMVLFLSVDPLSKRAWHAAVYACGIYFALLVPPALAADRFGYAALSMANLGVGLLAAYAVALGMVQRFAGLRLATASSIDSPVTVSGHPLQFRLIDLMKWVTLICFALGIWSAVTSRFLSPEPLVEWRGVFYSYDLLPKEKDMWLVTGVLGGPVMLLQLGVYRLVLTHNPQRWEWIIVFGILWLFSLFVCFGMPLYLVAGLIHALPMRWMGWRMVPSYRRPFRVGG
ncbi:MAG TPA: hypothetical protein VMP01_19250 [Pirellulaceae bacterium]|nr:hypothetical protein [Pirellulaceae bacterium]